ncbi:hypothetical protein Pla123a_31170 [Posidoniimonas polymericola]|uniref:Type VI secretion protein, VC_A0114 family n=2 Tax=Posidoniimonas polymericola TaxID=2528002 RepID=A0A5C5YL82_9BACT|nr:hypothetical protein Pla123a_31170 [Posidoniimonas polymericola]
MSMCEHSVHWHEGMFLTPHHFQAADRRNAQLRQLGSQWDSHYNWGLRAVEIDADALANHRLVVRRLRARMPDGELLSFPEDASLPVLDLQAALRKHERVTIYLALPLENDTRPNTTANGADLVARRVIDTRQTLDENSGDQPQPIQVLRPNARLLVTGDDLAGFVVLPIGGVRRSESSTGSPVVDHEFIPPLLSCDAWPPLHQGVLGRLLDRIEKKAEVIGSQAAARQIGFDSAGPGERLMLEQLRELNAATAVLRIDATSQGVAPLTLYRELARVVGRLSIFGPRGQLTPLPAYDHDDLAGCFLAVRAAIEGLLERVTQPAYQERLFTRKEMLLRADLDPAWLHSGRSLFVGVQSSLPADEVERLLSTGRNIKFGCANRADSLFLMGQAGLEPRRVVHTPRALPVRKGLQFYTLSADAAPEEWRHVERSMTVAARLSEQLLVDEFADSGSVVIDVDGKAATLRMSLFAVEDETAGAPTGVEANEPAELAAL